MSIIIKANNVKDPWMFMETPNSNGYWSTMSFSWSGSCSKIYGTHKELVVFNDDNKAWHLENAQVLIENSDATDSRYVATFDCARELTKQDIQKLKRWIVRRKKKVSR